MSLLLALQGAPPAAPDLILVPFEDLLDANDDLPLDIPYFFEDALVLVPIDEPSDWFLDDEPYWSYPFEEPAAPEPDLILLVFEEGGDDGMDDSWDFQTLDWLANVGIYIPTYRPRRR